MTNQEDRRRFLIRVFAGAGTLFLAGCDQLSKSEWVQSLLSNDSRISRFTHRLIGPRKAMAQEFSEADLSPEFRSNGTSTPNNPAYQELAKNDFKDWALEVGGLVEKPQKFTLEQIRALPSRTQITRHDCVEGWSAIGKWKGTPLLEILSIVGVKSNAKFLVFHCADPMEDDGTNNYYESIDLEDAFHPQTILAYELNDKTLPVPNGAPIRVRVERQLGYKMAKYIMRIELVDSFEHIAGGKGGYWEDQGYEWYAGI